MIKRFGVLGSIVAGVLLAAVVACGDGTPASPSPTEQPTITVPSQGDELKDTEMMVEVAAPIEAVVINIAESFPPQYFVGVTSGLPNACHEYGDYAVDVDGETVRITVTNLKPAEAIACAEIYRTVETNIALGSEFKGGTTYTVNVNGVTETFVGQGGPSLDGPDATAADTVTGTVAYRERIALSPDAVVEIRLSDVSRADAPAVIIGEQTIVSPGQVPVSFEIEYDAALIDSRFTYAVQAWIMEGDRMVFINDTSYQVVTRDNPTHVDMVLVKVAAPPPAETPESEKPSMVEAPAPIEDVKVVVSESDSPEYSLQIVSGLPGGCVEFSGYEVSKEDNNVAITVTNLTPAEPVPCTAIYGRHEGEVALGTDFEPGETYVVAVNGEVTNSFVGRDPEGREMVLKASPVESVEVVVSDSLEYSLAVVSRLPAGSSCSQFNGYDVARRSGDRLDVTVTHLEVAPQAGPVPCTADLPVVSTEIPLGTDFAPGETYQVVVNGEVMASFVGRDPEGREMTRTPSPIESVEVVTLESDPVLYSLVVVSRLPLGSSCSEFDGYTVARRFAGRIDVTVNHLEVVDRNVPCTRDLPAVMTVITLGSDFVSGESYAVVVNDDQEVTFTAQ